MRKFLVRVVRDVTAPNADTLYTAAWVDLGKEPWILGIPDMKDRYFLFPMLDGWTTVFRSPANAPQGPRPRPTPSPVPAGKARCQPA